jgi:uncharacterized protein
MIRAVLDTNIIISALLWGGLAQQIFNAARDERFVALLTGVLLVELTTTLSRDKFAEQLIRRKLTVDSIIEQYRAAVLFVDPAEVPADVVRDPKDQAVLACAVGGQADFIVSGDKDLLVLSSYKNIAIVDARQFLERLSAE